MSIIKEKSSTRYYIPSIGPPSSGMGLSAPSGHFGGAKHLLAELIDRLSDELRNRSVPVILLDSVVGERTIECILRVQGYQGYQFPLVIANRPVQLHGPASKCGRTFPFLLESYLLRGLH